MRIVFLLQEAADLCAGRWPLVQAVRASGDEVVVMAPAPLRDPPDGSVLPLVPWSLRRGGLNALHEARALWQVLRVYRRLHPDVVYHVRVKSVVYGGLAARLLGIPSINLLTGLGHALQRDAAPRHLLLHAVRRVLQPPGARLVVQNPDDRAELVRHGVASAARTSIVPGSGVDTDRFAPAGAEPPGPPVVLMAGRMLEIKGIRDFVAAARLVRSRGGNARFVLAGAPDPDSPSSVPERELRGWVAEGVVEWWGRHGDMPDVYRRAAIVCAPSHGGEGIPRVLVEAAACGRPLVATDVAGCREVVRPGVTGTLVPPRDPAALAAAIRVLVADPAGRARMGAEGRALAVARFGQAEVVARFLALQREIAGGAGWARTGSAATGLATRRSPRRHPGLRP